MNFIEVILYVAIVAIAYAAGHHHGYALGEDRGFRIARLQVNDARKPEPTRS